MSKYDGSSLSKTGDMNICQSQLHHVVVLSSAPDKEWPMDSSPSSVPAYKFNLIAYQYLEIQRLVDIMLSWSPMSRTPE